MEKLIHILHKIFFPIQYLYYKLVRKSTLDVRAIVLNDKKKVLLVQHTYLSGWYLPGGLVKQGETLASAIVRELYEETGIRPKSQPKLFNIYLGSMRGVPNYPAVFIIDNYSLSPNSNYEIKQMAWYDWNEIPEDTSGATKRRLDEYFGNKEVSEFW